MKKVVTIFASLLLTSSLSFAQTMDMNMTTPEGNINMGMDIKETSDGGVIMNMQMDTPEGKVNMGTSANPNGVNTNMNVREVRSSRNVSSSVNAAEYSEDAPIQEAPIQSVQTQNVNTNRCSFAMSQGDFNSLLSSIKKQGFDDGRIAVAKQAISSNCVSASQVGDLMRTFSFDDNRLELAKMCFSRVVDANNYYIVNDAFQFSDSAEKLANYIMSRK